MFCVSPSALPSYIGQTSTQENGHLKWEVDALRAELTEAEERSKGWLQVRTPQPRHFSPTSILLAENNVSITTVSTDGDFTNTLKQ